MHTLVEQDACYCHGGIVVVIDGNAPFSAACGFREVQRTTITLNIAGGHMAIGATIDVAEAGMPDTRLSLDAYGAAEVLSRRQNPDADSRLAMRIKFDHGPGAILADAAVHQLFRFRYGLVVNVDPAYVEAKCPGIQAAHMRTYRQMAFAQMASLSLPLGLLDNGSTFSPTQAMLDLDVSRAQYKLARGFEVTDETLCVDLINELRFCEDGTYLESNHTLRHFREVAWDTTLMDRGYRRTDRLDPQEEDRDLLDRADRAWRDVLAEHEPIEVDPRFADEIDRIVESAKRELLH